MRDQLPLHFAELTLVSCVNGEIVESNQRVLIKSFMERYLDVINENNEDKTLSMYVDYMDESPRVSNIKFLSSDEDDYREFVTTVQQKDVIDTIKKLSKEVNRVFDDIMDVSPESVDTLMEMLELAVKQNSKF